MRWAAALSVALAVGVLADVAVAVGGRLDRSFSNDGRATAFPQGATGYAMALDAKGRVVVAGYTLGSDTDLAIARFRTDGKLDRNFGGGDGRVTTDLGGTDYGFDVAIAKGGRIVVVGERQRSSGSKMAVAVYGPQGKLDRDFSRNGIAFVGFGKEFQGANAVAVGSNGKIVIGGSTSNGQTSRWALARLSPSGARDRGFGADGRVTADLSRSAEQINDLAIVEGGRIVAVGSAEAGLSPRIAIARFLIGGKPDRSFGKRGAKITNVGKGAETANGLAEQPNGKLVVVGYVSNAGDADWGVLRYGPKGRLDDTWHGDGIRILGFGRDYEFAQAAVVQSNGRIVVAGRIRRKDDDHVGVVRLKPNASYDLGFSDDGQLVIDFDRGSDTGRDVALQDNGKIVVVGEATKGRARRFGVARMHAS